MLRTSMLVVAVRDLDGSADRTVDEVVTTGFITTSPDVKCPPGTSNMYSIQVAPHGSGHRKI
jgi:hypothetical protein